MFGGDSSHDFQAKPQHERRADIPPLVAHFIDRCNKEARKQLRGGALQKHRIEVRKF